MLKRRNFFEILVPFQRELEGSGRCQPGVSPIGSQIRKEIFSLILTRNLAIRSSRIFKVRVWRMLLSFLCSLHLANARCKPQDKARISHGSNSKELLHGRLDVIGTDSRDRPGYISRTRKQPTELDGLAGCHNRKMNFKPSSNFERYYSERPCIGNSFRRKPPSNYQAVNVNEGSIHSNI